MHQIVRGNRNTDLTQTTLSNQAVLKRHNVIDAETVKNSTVSLALMIVYAKLSFRLVKIRRSRSLSVH